MKLRVINSNSKGNCYLLVDNSGKMLMIECGVRMDKIKQALNFETANVCGCIVTHEHQDHCSSVKDVAAAGIDIYASKGTLGCFKMDSHRLKTMLPMKIHDIGPYSIIPFNVKHDAMEPFGFLVKHVEMGNLLFLTDTYYCEHTFENLNNILIEINYSKKIIDGKLASGAGTGFLRDRVLQSHMELETAKDLLRSNDLTRVNNIVLIHLSDANSHAREFQTEIRELTGKNVHVAEAGMEIGLNQTPF